MGHRLQNFLIFFPVRMLHLLSRLDIVFEIPAGVLPCSKTLGKELCCLAGVLVWDGIVVAQGRAARGSCRASGGECGGHCEACEGLKSFCMEGELLIRGQRGGLYVCASSDLHRGLDEAQSSCRFRLNFVWKRDFRELGDQTTNTMISNIADIGNEAVQSKYFLFRPLYP